MERLTTTSHVLSETTLEKRASKACEICRQKKIKCDESQPSCRYCRRRKLVCHYRKDHQPARDPSLHLILDQISQLNRAFQSVEGRMSRLEDSIQISSFPDTSLIARPGIHTQNYSNVLVQKEATEPHPTSSILQWQRIRHMYPTVTSQSACEDAYSTYAPTMQPSLNSLHIEIQSNDTGQLLFYTRCFLDLVYPLYPIMCEDALYDAVTACIRDGFQDNISSALVLLMVCLGKLYSISASVGEAIGYLNMGTRLLSWIPMEISLDHAQANTLSALCFAKLSMLSTASGYLERGSDILHLFLLEKTLKPQGTKLTTRTTSIRLYWVLLNMERDINWETRLKSTSRLSELEDRLPLPFECMAQEPATASQLHSPYTSVIESCYSLFLAETSLRQILWRVACAPELQGSTAQSPKPSRALEVIAELEVQLSEWLVCIPGSAGWSPVAGAGSVSPLSSRVKLQYWLCRLHIYKVALYRSFQVPYQMVFPESISQSWSDATLVAAMNCLLVFVSESVVPHDIMANRILTVAILLQASIQLFGPDRLTQCCPSMSTSPQSLIEQSLQRLQSLSIINPAVGSPKWQSRWVMNTLQSFLQDVSRETAQS